jgi:hypothetical protein
LEYVFKTFEILTKRLEKWESFCVYIMTTLIFSEFKVLIWEKYHQSKMYHHQASKLKKISSSRLLMLICFGSNIGGVSSRTALVLLGVTFILIAGTVVGIVLGILLMNDGEYLSV